MTRRQGCFARVVKIGLNNSSSSYVLDSWRSTLKTLLSMLVLFAASSFGADVTGTWSGPMQMTRGGETRDDNAHFVLTQTGSDVKGTVGPNIEKQMPITKGTIEGSDLVLEATPPNGSGKIVIRLKVDGDKLTGDLKAEGGEGEPFTGTLALTKVK
jgi:hypothetical protein